MPINPNIALGAQTPAPVNLLGQMGQMLALKAAAQDTEGYEGVKGAITGGMSPTDPRMLQFGKRGIDAFKAAGEGSVKQQDALAKAYTNSREALSLVRSPEDLLAYSISQFSDPLIGPSLKARGLTPESVAANLQKELSTSGFETVLKKSAMGLDKFFEDQTKRRNTDVSAGASIYGSNISRENSLRSDARMREQQAFERDRRSVIAGEGQFLQTDAYGNVYPVATYGATRGPNAPAPAMPPAAANAFVTTQPSVNALAPTAPVVQPGSPTVANALAMDQQNNIPRPKVPFRPPVAVLIDDKPVMVAADKAIGMTPATPGAEQAALKKGIAKEGKESVNNVLNTLYAEYSNLVKSGGITDTRRSVEENISARTGASAVGQLTGSFTGSESQSFRDTIAQTRPLLLTAIMKATGLSATQLNSNVELQTYLKTATDDKVSIQSNVNAMNNISQMFGLGEKFEVPALPKAGASPKAAKPADIPPAGLDPEIAGLWKYMSPEDRKLWQK